MALDLEEKIRKGELEQLTSILAEYYGISGELKLLEGECDLNLRIKMSEKTFLCKITRSDEDLDQIDLQCKIVQYLESKGFPYEIPRIIPSKNGNRFEILDNGMVLRIQSWVKGFMLSEARPRSEDLLSQWGVLSGQLSKCLQDFDHPAAHRKYAWDPDHTMAAKAYLNYVSNKDRYACAKYFFDLFEEEAVDIIQYLRSSINYNDAHEHNVLIAEDLKNIKITGLIDFGDSVYTSTLNEIAITCAYAGMNMVDPISAMCHVLKAYHSEFELEERELQCLFYLIFGRLLISVCHAAKNAHEDPDNIYLQISAKPAWDLLFRLREIHPNFAHYAFRHTCGLEACPEEKEYSKWLKEHRSEVKPILNMENLRSGHIDLSISSKVLGNNSRFLDHDIFQRTISRYLEDMGWDIAIGGYLECRPFYLSEEFVSQTNQGKDWRTMHLGLDFWTDEGTSVYSPLSSVVYSIHDNAGYCNYGPTLILEHTIEKDQKFYTLYGHLKRSSVEHLEKGMSIKAGDKIAEIGGIEENGNWPPHLHFQIMLDILGNTIDYPGVALPSEREIWTSLCPDPSIFLDLKIKSNRSHSTNDLIEIRNKNLGRSLSVSYKTPLHIVRAFKQHLYDNQGRRYLDTVNNVPHVGHQHPRVIRAACEQIELLNTNTRYVHEAILDYSKKLLSCFPEKLSVVHFVNSGSEANELAMRMAEVCTGSKEIIAVQNAYHGNTKACIDISGYKFDGKGGSGPGPHTHVLPMPDPYRDKLDYKNEISEILSSLELQEKRPAAFICESILSCGGQIVLPDGFLEEIYNQVRNKGALCIADEVQVGFGRLGDYFWGFQQQNVVPDIVTLGKPIGNGHPIAAVVCTAEVAEAFANGMEYFSTFGGNPVSCVIANEVLSVIEDEYLQDNAKKVGDYIKIELNKLKDQFNLIGDVRGYGLFLGMELVLDQESKIPATLEASHLVNRMRERGILMSYDGPFNNVIKIKPPMCFSLADADRLLNELHLVLSESYFREFSVQYI